MRKANVLQHEYAIAKSDSCDLVLSTKDILICTCWYGWDKANKIAFLCHFDHPCSANSVPFIIDEIKKIAPDIHKFNSVLVGGKWWCYSKRTRRKIKDHIENQNILNIKIKDGPFDNPFCQKRNILISASEGRLPTEKLTGKSCPSGIKWFFGPMRKTKIIA